MWNERRLISIIVQQLILVWKKESKPFTHYFKISNKLIFVENERNERDFFAA